MQARTPDGTDFTVVQTMLDAVESGDMVALRACFTPDARVWHNHDGIEQDVDGVIAALSGLCALSSSRAYEDRRITTVGSLAFLNHTLTAELHSGDRMVLPAAMRIEVTDGRVKRIDEYFDSRATDVLASAAAAQAQ